MEPLMANKCKKVIIPTLIDVDWDEIFDDAKSRGDLQALTVDVQMNMSKKAQEFYVSQLKQVNGYDEIIQLYRRTVDMDEEIKSDSISWPDGRSKQRAYTIWPDGRSRK